MKIKNKKKFILSNLILFSILLLLFSVSKISLSKTIVQYTDIYIEEGDTLWQIAKLRHTAATLMYKYGNVDIRALQELLGHESISTTEIYTHVDNSQIRKAVESNPLANM